MIIVFSGAFSPNNFKDIKTFTPWWTGPLRSLYCPTFTVGLVFIDVVVYGVGDRGGPDVPYLN